MRSMVLCMLAGCTHPSLNRARADWAAADLESYSYSVSIGTFSGGSSARVDVEGGSVSYQLLGDPSEPTVESPPGLTGMDGLHDWIDATYDVADEVDVEYSAIGVPLSVSVDRFRDAIDDELGVGVFDFEAR